MTYKINGGSQHISCFSTPTPGVFLTENGILHATDPIGLEFATRDEKMPRVCV